MREPSFKRMESTIEICLACDYSKLDYTAWYPSSESLQKKLEVAATEYHNTTDRTTSDWSKITVPIYPETKDVVD